MKRLSYERKKSMTGRAFILVWVIGVLVFFVVPFIRTVFYSLNTLNFRTLETSPPARRIFPASLRRIPASSRI